MCAVDLERVDPTGGLIASLRRPRQRVDSDRRASIVARARHIYAPREAIFRVRRRRFYR